MAPLRLAAFGLHHESNTFARVATDMAAFERAGVLRGEQIRAAWSQVSGSPRALSSSAFRSRPGTLVSSEVLARVLS